MSAADLVTLALVVAVFLTLVVLMVLDPAHLVDPEDTPTDE